MKNMLISAMASLICTSTSPRSKGYFMSTRPVRDDGSHLPSAVQLTIGRYGFSSISFVDPFELANLPDVRRLDTLIECEAQSVEVYPNRLPTPPVGHGLNKPAIVTFHNLSSSSAWKLVRSHGNTRDTTQLLLLKGGKREISDGPACLVSFDELSGTLQVYVPSFSKYSLFPSSDHDQGDQGAGTSSKLSIGHPKSVPGTFSLPHESSGREAFYTRNSSQIIINNGPPRANQHLSEFRDRRNLQNSITAIPPRDDHVNGLQLTDFSNDSPSADSGLRKGGHISLYPRLDFQTDDSSGTGHRSPDGPPPLEGDPDDPAMLLREQSFSPSETAHARQGANQSLSVSQASDDLTGPHRLSKASLAALDRFLPVVLECSPVISESGRVMIGSPENIPVFLTKLIQSTSGAEDIDAEDIRTVRYVAELLAALHVRSGVHVTSPADDGEIGQAFLRWIRNVLPDMHGKDVESSDLDLSQTDWFEVHRHVLHLLSVGQLHEAARFAVKERDFELAHLISSVASPPVSEKVDAELQAMLAVNLTDESTVLAAKILLLLTGVMSSSTVSACEGLDWLTCLGMYALFAVDPTAESNLAAMMTVYEEAELSDFGWTGPSSGPSAILYDIISLFLGRTDLVSVLERVDVSDLDITCKWLLFILIMSLHPASDDDSRFHSVCANLAESLEQESEQQQWGNAGIVWLHTTPSTARDDRIKTLIVTGIRNSSFEVDLRSIEHLIVDTLYLPQAWVWEGKAARALLNHQHGVAARVYTDLKQYDTAVRLVLENILPDIERSGTSGTYRDFIYVTDKLSLVTDLPELAGYRPFVPLMDVLKTFGRLHEGDNMAAVLVEQLEKDLEAAKRLPVNVEVSPVMRKLVNSVDTYLNELRLKRTNRRPDGSLISWLCRFLP